MSGLRWVPSLTAAAILLSCASPSPPAARSLQRSTSAPPATHHATQSRAASPSPSRGVPSQSKPDAARDGVVPAVAALPVSRRVRAMRTVHTREGVWVASQLPVWTPNPLGPASGRYGKDVVNSVEFGEVLLMDPRQHRILRAFPLPGFPPEELLVGPRAVYCAKQGDGGLPDSMLCRIDRRTLRWRTRIFPFQLNSPLSPRRYLPRNWVVNAPVDQPSSKDSSPATTASSSPGDTPVRRRWTR